MFDHHLVLPEYLVEFEYVLRHAMSPGVCGCARVFVCVCMCVCVCVNSTRYSHTHTHTHTHTHMTPEPPISFMTDLVDKGVLQPQVLSLLALLAQKVHSIYYTQFRTRACFRCRCSVYLFY